MDCYLHQVLTKHLLTKQQYRVLEDNKAEVLREQHIVAMWKLFAKYYNDNSSQTVNNSTSNATSKIGSTVTSIEHHSYTVHQKVHKKVVPLCPIFSKVNSKIEILSIFLDHQLQRVLPLCKFYIHDSWHLLEKICELVTLPPDAQLVTVDAQSMYSNIDTEHTIKSIGKWFDSHKHELPTDYPTKFILEGIRLVMELNIFYFDDIFATNSIAQRWALLLLAFTPPSTSVTMKRTTYSGQAILTRSSSMHALLTTDS